MEDDAKSSTRRSKVSSGSHMDVSFKRGIKKDINRTFCMRMRQNTGNRKGNWPNGRFIHTDCNRNKNYYRLLLVSYPVYFSLVLVIFRLLSKKYIIFLL